MKRAIIIAALVLTPMTASAWDNRRADPYYEEMSQSYIDMPNDVVV